MHRFKFVPLIFPLLILLAGERATDSKAKRSRPPEVGQCAPDFKLLDHAGEPVQLSGFRGKQNVVLVFYRFYRGSF
jgi:hypothetical protein